MDRILQRQIFALFSALLLFGADFSNAAPRKSSSFGGSSYPRQGGISSGSSRSSFGGGSYPRQSGISSASKHPGYTPFASNPYSSSRTTGGFGGSSYPRQAGMGGNTYNTYNRPTYSSSSYPSSSLGGAGLGGLGGAGLGGLGGFGRGSSSFARPSTSRIGGRDMLKIGAGVAGGYLAGKAISNMFSPRYPGGYWNDQNRYYYDQGQDRYYDSRRQQYSQAPPCDKPGAAGANTTQTDWQMYSECLEYFNQYKQQFQQQQGGMGGMGYYGAATTIVNSSLTLMTLVFAAILSTGAAHFIRMQMIKL